MYRNTLITIMLFMTLGIVSSIFPCQTYTLKKGKVLIVGHNLGAKLHVPAAVVINKRDVRKKAISFKELLSGKPVPNPPLEWISRYGSATFNAFGRDFPDGGMNETGLYIGEMTLNATRFPEDESKPLLFMMLWMQYVLDNFKSIDQVVQSAHDLSIDGWTWHFFTADKTGNSAVIEFVNGDLFVFKGNELPYPLLCNTLYTEELKNLRRYRGYGGDEAVDLQNHEQERFVHGVQMIGDFDPAKDQPIEYGFIILNQFDRGGTQWSLVCDLKNLKIYFRSKSSKKIKEISLKHLDLSGKSPVRMIDYHIDVEGNVEKYFSDYSLQKNVAVITTTISVLGKGFEDYLTSQGSTINEVISRLAGYSEKEK